MDNPLRRWDVRHALDRAGLRPGETALELGPGPGAFTVDAAQRVGPEGRLIAVDIQLGMIAQVNARVKAAGLTNVETHVASAYELPIADASVDRAFLITVLPEIPDPVRALREIHRVLKPGSIISTTEEFLDPDYPRHAVLDANTRNIDLPCFALCPIMKVLRITKYLSKILHQRTKFSQTNSQIKAKSF